MLAGLPEAEMGEVCVAVGAGLAAGRLGEGDGEGEKERAREAIPPECSVIFFLLIIFVANTLPSLSHFLASKKAISICSFR